MVNIIVARYYFPSASRLVSAPAGSAMAGLILGTIILATTPSIVISILICIWRKPGRKSERDYRFSTRGSMIAYTALLTFMMLMIGQVLFESLCPGIAQKWWLITSPLIMAHLLTLSITFSSTTKSVVQLISYRRGY
jgi:hypothetical protein